MLGKQVQKILISQSHDTLRAIELGLEDLSNSDLYKEAIKVNRILVTCDSDFEINRIGKLSNPSIIYLKVYPDNSFKHLLPFLNMQFPKIPKDKINDHLITVFNDEIIISKF